LGGLLALEDTPGDTGLAADLDAEPPRYTGPCSAAVLAAILDGAHCLTRRAEPARQIGGDEIARWVVQPEAGGPVLDLRSDEAAGHQTFVYLTMTPQAMRPPLLPVGSVFMSSGAAWTMMAVPLSPRSELGPGPSVTSLLT